MIAAKNFHVTSFPANEFKSRIADFSKLRENWDGFGAAVPKIQTIRQAKNLLDCLPAQALKFLIADHISATPYGTIEMDFRKENALLSIEVGATKIGFFSKFPDGTNPESDGEVFSEFQIPPKLAAAYFQFLKL